MTAHDLLAQAERLLAAADLSYGHGTGNARDEAAWLVLWSLGLPLDTDTAALPSAPLAASDVQCALSLIEERIRTRKPAAYLTREAWLQGVPFHVDERCIVPRSFIAELIAEAPEADSLDPWLRADTRRVLDLCTGNGSLAVLAALAWPEVQVDASDLSPDALAVARINVDRHGLAGRIRLIESDGWTHLPDSYDLVLCNPPYVSRASMDSLPPEYRHEPRLALDGGPQGGADGMDLIRPWLQQAPQHLNPGGVLVLEIGHERAHFEAAFPRLEASWPLTSAGEGAVVLLTREALLRQAAQA